MSTPEANTGTKPVADQHAFDVAVLERYLRANLAGFAGPLTVEQFKGGQSNPTYKLLTPARAYVMRSKPGPAAKLLPSAHAVEREFKVMRALHDTAVPVPEMFVLCEDEGIVGRAFYVMEFVEGRVLWDQALPAFDNAGRAAIYDEMNRVIAALHSVDPRPGRPRRLRQAGQLLRAPDRALDEAVPGLDHHAHRGDGSSHRVAARAHSGERPRRHAGARRARRLPARQHGLSSERAARRGRARLGAVDARPSPRGLQLPLHVVAHPARVVSRHRRPRLRGARDPDREGIRAPLLRAHRPRRSRRGHGRLEFLHGLQPVSHGRHPARHRQAGRGRHGVERAGAPVGRRRTAARRDGLADRTGSPEVRTGASTQRIHRRQSWTSNTRLAPRSCRRSCFASWTSTSIRPSSATRTRSRPTPRPASAGRRCRRSSSSSRRRAPRACGTCSCRRLPAARARRKAAAASACRTATTRRWPRSWAACPGRPRSSTARRRIPATWRRSNATARPTSRSNGSSRCSTARSAAPSR